MIGQKEQYRSVQRPATTTKHVWRSIIKWRNSSELPHICGNCRGNPLENTENNVFNITTYCSYYNNLKYLSGVKNFSMLQYVVGKKTYIMSMFGDVHDGKTQVCNDSNTTHTYVEVVKLIRELMSCTSIPTHLYLEDYFKARDDMSKPDKRSEDFMDDMRYEFGTAYRNHRFRNSYVHYTDFRLFRFLIGMSGSDYTEQRLPEQHALRQALNTDFGGKTWQEVMSAIFKIMLGDNFIQTLLAYTPNYNNYLIYVFGKDWFIQETTLIDGVRVHKIRAAIIKLDYDPVIANIVQEFVDVCIRNMYNLKYFANEYESDSKYIIKFVRENFPVTKDFLSISADIASFGGSPLLEIYILARSFREFTIDEMSNTKHIIIYSGAAHVRHFMTILPSILRRHAEQLKVLVTSQYHQDRCTYLDVKTNLNFDVS